MKKLVSFVLAATCVAFFSIKSIAQEVDVNEGIGLYNKATEAYNNKQYDQAIQYGNDAYKIAVDAGEEGTELKKNMETLIPQLYLGKANSLVTEKKFDDAIAAFNEAKAVAEKYNSADVKVNIDEAFPKLYMAKGLAEFEAETYDSAISSLDKAIEMYPNGAQAYLLKGAIYFKNKDYSNAETAFLKCIEIGTETNDDSNVKGASTQLSTVYLLKAQEAMGAKKWADMLTAAEKSLAINESLNGYKMKGLAATQLKKWDAVIEAYDKIITMGTEKDKPVAYHNIATAYQAKNNKSKACEFYKKLTNDANYKANAEHNIKVVLKCN